MKQKQIALVLIIILLNIFNKSWKDITKYYKNLILVLGLNAFYYYLCKRHLVWEFRPGEFSWRGLRALHTFIVTPLVILLYLSKLPKTLSKQIVYTINWTLGSIIGEYFLHRQKMIKYKYGWNLFWSGLLFFKMYVYSNIFTKNPFSASILSLCSIIFFILKFHVPLTKRLLKGPFHIFLPKKIKIVQKYKICIGAFPKRLSNKIKSIIKNKHVIL
ncbi:hypothetical protein ACNQFZ_04915 [Schinkia sp. CFF1]